MYACMYKYIYISTYIRAYMNRCVDIYIYICICTYGRQTPKRWNMIGLQPHAKERRKPNINHPATMFRLLGVCYMLHLYKEVCLNDRSVSSEL